MLCVSNEEILRKMETKWSLIFRIRKRGQIFGTHNEKRWFGKFETQRILRDSGKQ